MRHRIDTLFTDLRARNAKALMPFLTAGDPDLDTTASLIREADAAGATVCEIGIPFSDPVADGPVIEASMCRALEGGATVQKVFDMVASVRGEVSIGLVAMVSYSIVHRWGLSKFVADAAAAGFDGFIFPDLSLEASAPARAAAADAGLSLSLLIAPTTPLARARDIAQACSGFVYVVSRAGITGAGRSLPAELPDRLKTLREVTDLPITVGFGVSSAAHVREVVAVADAAIVGSALVNAVASAASPIAAGRAMMDELVTGLTA
ncbi:MAG: tryptophan synthase subunit alpha [Algisphaera sp.]